MIGDRWLLAVCASRTFGTFVFMTYAAALPVLLDAWRLTGTTAGSTAFTEAVSPAYLGSGLALRSLLGFGAGAIAPLVFGAILDLTNPPGVRTHWGWAFVSLGLGGAAATLCAWRLAGPRARAGAAA